MKIQLFILCNILILSFAPISEANKPGYVGPEIRKIHFLLDKKNIVYAVEGSSNVFKSTDNGVSWVYQKQGMELLKADKISNSDRQNIEGACGNAITAPSSPNIIYSICYEGSNSGGHSDFKKSVNYGQTWQILGNGLPHYWFATSLAVNPRDPNLLLAGWANGGLFRSLDGGKTWKRSDKGLIDTHESFRHYLLQPALHKAVLDNDIKQAAKTLKKGADIEEESEGMTPLLLAIDLNLAQLTQFLLSQGANVHAKDSYGNTALYIAIRKKNPELVRLVLNAGIDVNEFVSERSTSALMSSIDAPINLDMIKLLVNRGANLDDPALMAHAVDYNLNYRDYESKQLELVNYLFDKGVPLTYENNGNNLVLYAAWLCKPEIVRFFLKNGLLPNIDQNSIPHRPQNANLACYDGSKELFNHLLK